MPDIKPCPFCGGTELKEFQQDWFVCADCGAQGPDPGYGHSDWNTRPVEDALREIAKKLYQACGPERDIWPKSFADEVVRKIRAECESFISQPTTRP